jgi:AraC family transcriptional regulator, ethanolamine operon transcriptional activator
MRKARKILARSEPEIFVDTINLQDLPVSALAHVVAGAELEHRWLPGGGSRITLWQCRLPHSVISQGIYEPAVLANGMFAPNAVTVSAMLFQDEATIFNGSKIRRGTIQFCSETAEVCYRAWPDTSWFAFVIPREELLKFCADHLERVPALPSAGIAIIDPTTKKNGDRFLGSLRELSRSLRSLGSVQHAVRLGELVEQDILAKLSRFLGAKPLLHKSGDRRRLRMCAEVLRDATALVKNDPNEMLDLQAMSKATGFSIRTVQRAFQAEFGLCSQEWLRVERLHRVRDDLLNETYGTSVMKTATRWGFFHLGRFSQHYRDLFGESPSVTVARRARIMSNLTEINRRFLVFERHIARSSVFCRNSDSA